MEKLIDFDQWYLNYKLPPVQFVAVFDPNTGMVLSVGPSHAFVNEKNKIPIDDELALSIINAEVKISNCVVDINSNTVEIAEIKSVFKIDDVLHRIISKKDSELKLHDVYLKHDSKTNCLKIELSVEYGGTKKSRAGLKKRNIVWDGDTEMLFFITDYNDPNVLLETVSVKINELLGTAKIIPNINFTKFSVYTRRIFKRYVIEYK